MALPEERRYTVEEFYTLTGEERCELIDGYIVDMSPSPNQTHQWIQGELFADIRSFIRARGGKCKPFMTSDVRLTEKTIIIPDIYVTCHPENLDGQRHNGAPDWVIEIASPSNFIEDYRKKLRLYMEHGVREYWIVDPDKEQVNVYIHDGDYTTLDFYRLSDKIPVHIFKDKTPPLEICIADYTESLKN